MSADSWCFQLVTPLLFAHHCLHLLSCRHLLSSCTSASCSPMPAPLDRQPLHLLLHCGLLSAIAFASASASCHASDSCRAPHVWLVIMSPPNRRCPRTTTTSCYIAAYTFYQAATAPCSTTYFCASAFHCVPLIWLVVAYPPICRLCLLSSLSCLAGFPVASCLPVPMSLIEPWLPVAAPSPISGHLCLSSSCGLLLRISLLLRLSHG